MVRRKRSQADTLQVVERAPVLTGQRHRGGQQVRPNLCHLLRGGGHLVRSCRGMTLDTDEHADSQNHGRGG